MMMTLEARLLQMVFVPDVHVGWLCLKQQLCLGKLFLVAICPDADGLDLT